MRADDFHSPELLSSMQILLEKIGEDPDREGLVKTPTRFLKSFSYLTSGYQQSPKEVINGALFEIPEASSSEIVIIKNIELYSLCEHHLLPFYGKCHVGYLPRGRIIGLSKIPRLIDVFARRLQVQERLTGQIAQALMEHLTPSGVGVVIEAYHFCMMMRGVQKQGALAKTSSMLGTFQEKEKKLEFFKLIE